MEKLSEVEKDILYLFRRLSGDVLQDRIDIKGKETTLSAYRISYPNRVGSYIRIDIHRSDLYATG